MAAEQGVYRIGAVARMTGVSAHALRAWERRYPNLHPIRTATGLRLYSDAQVERLQLIHKLLAAGHAIGTLAPLGPSELLQLAQGRRPTPTVRVPERALQPREDALTATFAPRFLEAMTRHDLEMAERLVAQAFLAFAPSQLVASVLAPLLREVGAQWADGRLTIADEHAISALLRSELGAQLRTFRPAADAPIAVVSTPAGELHELGALLAAFLAAASGWNVRYLGPNLPASEIAEAARRWQADCVLLSAVCMSTAAALDEILLVRGLLPHKTGLLIGGAALADVVPPPGTTFVAQLEDVPDALAGASARWRDLDTHANA